MNKGSFKVGEVGVMNILRADAVGSFVFGVFGMVNAIMEVNVSVPWLIYSSL